MTQLNLPNLVTPTQSINESKSNSLVISSNYDLLDNDGRTVSWNPDGTVQIKRPAGLSELKKIRFRNFKSYQLPYTSLELPNLKVHIRMTSNGADSAFVEGSDTVFGERDTYERAAKNIEDNDIVSFTKAWTYDSNYESQIEYNLKECVEECNRRLLERFPHAFWKVVFETGRNEWAHVQYDDYLEVPTSGSYQLVVKRNDIKKAYLLWPTAEHYDNLINLPYVPTDRTPAFATVDFGATIIGLWTEQWKNYKWWGEMRIMYNNGTLDNPNWQLYNYNRWEGGNPNPNMLCFHPRETPITIGKYDGNSCTIISPHLRQELRGNESIFIVAKDNGAYRGFWIDPMVEDGQIACYSLVTIDTWCYLLCFRYMNIDGVKYAIPQISKFAKSLLADSAENNPFKLNRPEVTTYYPLNSDYHKWKLDTFWTNKIRHGTAGKETYDIVFNGSPSDPSDSRIYFVGTFMCQISGGVLTECVESFAYRHRCSSLLADGALAKGVGGYVSIAYSELTNPDNYSMMIENGGYWMKGTFFYATSFPILCVSNYNECFMLGSFYEGMAQEALEDNRFIGCDLNEKNGWNCRQDDTLNLKSNITVGSQTVNMVASQDGLATTDVNEFFEFQHDTSDPKNPPKVLIPQLNYTNGMALNFSMLIETDPFYFAVYTPIEYFTNTNWSLIHAFEPFIYRQLNEHVLATMETLILQKYEFNDIELVCSTFPNGDGVVFHSNEESQVEFKEMTTDNTQDSINLQLVSGGEILQLETLKALYGGITVSVDWVA